MLKIRDRKGVRRGGITSGNKLTKGKHHMHPCESGTWVSDVSCRVLSRWEGDEHHWYVP